MWSAVHLLTSVAAVARQEAVVMDAKGEIVARAFESVDTSVKPGNEKLAPIAELVVADLAARVDEFNAQGIADIAALKEETAGLGARLSDFRAARARNKEGRTIKVQDTESKRRVLDALASGFDLVEKQVSEGSIELGVQAVRDGRATLGMDLGTSQYVLPARLSGADVGDVSFEADAVAITVALGPGVASRDGADPLFAGTADDDLAVVHVQIPAPAGRDYGLLVFSLRIVSHTMQKYGLVRSLGFVSSDGNGPVGAETTLQPWTDHTSTSTRYSEAGGRARVDLGRLPALLRLASSANEGRARHARGNRMDTMGRAGRVHAPHVTLNGAMVGSSISTA